MKKISILIIILLAAVSCRQAEDTRYFAPGVQFSSGSVTIASGSGGCDLDVMLTDPAPQAMEVGLKVKSSLQEGTQFTVEPQTIKFVAGQQSAKVHIALVDDEIWDEASWVELVIAPGERYTINPDGNTSIRMDVTKVIDLPVLRFAAGAGVETNPYFAETVAFRVESNAAPRQDLDVVVDFGDFVSGEDYILDGGSFTFPAGATAASFDVKVVRKDISGYDKTVPLTLVPQKGKYVVASEAASAELHLSDPAVDFSPLFKTKAANNGTGYQVRQAILGPDGAWNGNTTADMWVSEEGSNYLRTYRNMFMHPSFSCMANASVSQMFRLSDLFPNLVYPSPTAILDYGNDQGHREFTPADSLMRFVLAPGETDKGTIHFNRRVTFTACIGSYEAWQENLAAGKAWVIDSRATKGDILASTHQAITGRISVTLENLEGAFDLSDKDAPVLVTAWFTSDSDQFMKDLDTSLYAVSQDNGCWKVNYKMYPR